MTSRTENWPADMQVEIARVPDAEVFANCSKGVPLWQLLLGSLPMACAHVDQQQKTCIVYVGVTSPDWVLEHELRHCNGEHHL